MWQRYQKCEPWGVVSPLKENRWRRYILLFYIEYNITQIVEKSTIVLDITWHHVILDLFRTILINVWLTDTSFGIFQTMSTLMANQIFPISQTKYSDTRTMTGTASDFTVRRFLIKNISPSKTPSFPNALSSSEVFILHKMYQQRSNNSPGSPRDVRLLQLTVTTIIIYHSWRGNSCWIHKCKRVLENAQSLQLNVENKILGSSEFWKIIKAVSVFCYKWPPGYHIFFE